MGKQFWIFWAICLLVIFSVEVIVTFNTQQSMSIVEETMQREKEALDYRLKKIAHEEWQAERIEIEKDLIHVSQDLEMLFGSAKEPEDKLCVGLLLIDEFQSQPEGGRRKGVYVEKVSCNSPASLAGIRAGDKIVMVDGRKVGDGLGSVQEFISLYSNGRWRTEGSEVMLVVIRPRASPIVEVNITLSTLPGGFFNFSGECSNRY